MPLDIVESLFTLTDLPLHVSILCLSCGSGHALSLFSRGLTVITSNTYLISSFCIQEGFYLWAQCTFNSCFSLFSTLALSSHTFLKEEEEHLKTIREGKRKPRPAGARLMRLQYNGEGHHICGVLAGMTDAGLLVTAGFPFWTSPHFSKDHLSNRHRAKFHMCVFNLCYFDLKQSVEL